MEKQNKTLEEAGIFTKQDWYLMMAGVIAVAVVWLMGMFVIFWTLEIL